MRERTSEKTSPWIWVGCGCALAIFLIAAAIVGVGVLAVRKAQEVAEELSTPEGRERAVLRTLGAERLPEGYYPVVGFGIPFVMDLAILSDLPPAEGASTEDQGFDEGGFDEQGFDERGFIYIKILTFGSQQQELQDFFEGSTDDPRVLRDNNVDLRLDEMVRRGETARDDAEVLWVVHRGEVDALGSSSRDGLVTMILIDCPDDERMRMGIWFGPDPDPDAAPEELDLAGTVGDADAVARMLEPIRPCG
jgi:hypothetical protein